MASPLLRIGTRGSKLALTQTGLVRDALAAAHPALATPGAIEIVVIEPRASRIEKLAAMNTIAEKSNGNANSEHQ